MSLAALQRERGKKLDKPRLLYYEGMRLNEAGRFPEADPLLRQAVGLSPNEPQYRDEWARALLGSGLTTAAYGELKEFVGTHPGSARAHLLMGKFYYIQRATDRAEAELQRSLQINSSDADAWEYLAASRDADGDLAGAEVAAEKAVRLRPRSAPEHLVLASLLARLNHPIQAGHEFARSIALAPRIAVAHSEYASWLLDSGATPSDRKLAETEARRAIALNSRDGAAQLTLGRVLILQNDDAAAEGPLNRAAALLPDDPGPALALAQSYRSVGKVEDAARWQRIYTQRQDYITERGKLLDEVRVNPEAPAPNKKLARLLGLHGDAVECARHYATALHVAQDSPPVLIAACKDLVDGGHAAAAEPLARLAVRFGGANPAAHEALGNVLLALGHPKEALQEYNLTLGWWPQRRAILRQRLKRYYARLAARPSPAQADFQEAVRVQRTTVGPRTPPPVEQLIKQAVALDPKNPLYLRALLTIQVERREEKDATSTAKRYLALAPEDAKAHALFAVVLADRAATPQDYADAAAQARLAASDPSTAATRYYVMGLLALRQRRGPEAVRELRHSIVLDPSAAVSYYKLSLAEDLVGDKADSAKAMDQYRVRQAAKRAEMNALRDIGQHSDDPAYYARAERLFKSQGLPQQAEAIRAAAQQRFKGARPPGTASHVQSSRRPA